MMKLTVLIILVSGLLMADSGTWKSFQSEGKLFTASFPCTSKNMLVNKNDFLTERQYKCEADGATYSLTQIVLTDAGKKALDTKPSTLVEDTSRDLQQKYRNEKQTIMLHKIFRQPPYYRLEMIAGADKKKNYTSIFDGPKGRIIFSASGPEKEDANMKKASDSIKPN